jgi:MFS family permease
MELGLVSAVRGIPLLAFGIFSGVIADRTDRKTLLLVAQIINAILNLILATLILTGQVEIWHIYVTAFIAGTAMSLQQPSRQALVHDIVGDKYLMNAIALTSASFNIARSVGPALCGVLINALGIDMAYYGQAAVYIFATICLFPIKIPQTQNHFDSLKTVADQSFITSLKEGFSYVFNHKMILVLMVLGLAPILLAMPYMSLMPIFAVDIFHGDAMLQGILLTTIGVGAVVGALTMATMSDWQGRGKLLIIAASGFGFFLVLFSQSPVLWMAMIFVFMTGLFHSSYGSQNQTIIQLLTPAELKGRVLGIYFLDQGLMPLGSLLAGALATWLGGPWAVTIMGTSCMLLAIGIAIAVPEVWKLNIGKASF